MPYPPKRKVMPKSRIEGTPPPIKDLDEAKFPRELKHTLKHPLGTLHKDVLGEWKSILRNTLLLFKLNTKTKAIDSSSNEKEALPVTSPLAAVIPPHEIGKYSAMLKYLHDKGINTIGEFISAYDMIKSDPYLKTAHPELGVNVTVDDFKNKVDEYFYYDPSKLSREAVAREMQRSFGNLNNAVKKLEDKSLGLAVIEKPDIVGVLMKHDPVSKGVKAENIKKTVLTINRGALETAVASDPKKLDKLHGKLVEMRKILRTPIMFLFPDMDPKIQRRLIKSGFYTLMDLFDIKDNKIKLNKKATVYLSLIANASPDNRITYTWVKNMLHNYLTLFTVYHKYAPRRQIMDTEIPLGRMQLHRPVNGYTGDFNVSLIFSKKAGEPLFRFVGKNSKGKPASFTATLSSIQNAINTRTLGDVKKIRNVTNTHIPKLPRHH